MNKFIRALDTGVLGLAAISAAAGNTSLAVLGIIIHLTYNKLYGGNL